MRNRLQEKRERRRGRKNSLFGPGAGGGRGEGGKEGIGDTKGLKVQRMKKSGDYNRRRRGAWIVEEGR